MEYLLVNNLFCKFFGIGGTSPSLVVAAYAEEHTIAALANLEVDGAVEILPLEIEKVVTIITKCVQVDSQVIRYLLARDKVGELGNHENRDAVRQILCEEERGLREQASVLSLVFRIGLRCVAVQCQVRFHDGFTVLCLGVTRPSNK